MTKYKQGLFHPKNPEKYVGNQDRIIYRSSYEFRFMTVCDLSEKVTRWSSEPFPIPYIDETSNTQHRYYVDFWLEYKKNDTLKKALIEIKPSSQTIKPVKSAKMTPKKERNYINEVMVYIKNISKWKAAMSFCDKAGIDFFIITEKNLNIFK